MSCTRLLIPFLSAQKSKILDLIEKGEKQPNLTIGILVSVVVVIFTILLRLIFGGKKNVRVEKNDTGVAEASKSQASSAEKEEEKEEEKEKEDTAAPRRRASRREN